MNTGLLYDSSPVMMKKQISIVTVRRDPENRYKSGSFKAAYGEEPD